MKTIKIPVKIENNKIIPLKKLPPIHQNENSFLVIEEENLLKQKKFFNIDVSEHLGEIKSDLRREDIYSDE